MPKAKTASKKVSYGELVSCLDETLAWFDTGELDLDLATEKYQKAMTLILQMEEYIKDAENKIKQIDTKLKA